MWIMSELASIHFGIPPSSWCGRQLIMGMEQNMELGFTRYWWYQMTTGWLHWCSHHATVTSESSQTRPWAHDLISSTGQHLMWLISRWFICLAPDPSWRGKMACSCGKMVISLAQFYSSTLNGRSNVRPFGTDHWLGIQQQSSDNSYSTQCKTVNTSENI